MLTLDIRMLRRQLRTLIDDWQALTTGKVLEMRALLEMALRDRIRWRPTMVNCAAACELTMPIGVDRLQSAIIPSLQVRVASPNATEPLPPAYRLLVPAA